MPKIHEVMAKFGFTCPRARPPRPLIADPVEREKIRQMYLEWLRSSPHAPLLGESPFLRLYGRLYFEKIAAESKQFAEQLEELRAFGAKIGGDSDA